MAPRYFEVEDPAAWSPSSYINHSISRSSSAIYGLNFASRKSPPETTARIHGQNVLQWVTALRALANDGSPELHRYYAKRQLAVLHKSKRTFSSWYARTFKADAAKRTARGKNMLDSGRQNHGGPSLSLNKTAQSYANRDGAGEAEEAREEDSDNEKGQDQGRDHYLGDIEGGRALARPIESDTMQIENLQPARKTPCPVSRNNEWRLASGRIVDDIVEKARLGNDYHLRPTTLALLSSNVIDMSDTAFRNIFSADEWVELLSEIPELPKSDMFLLKSLGRFCGIHTVEGLRRVIFDEDFKPGNEDYGPQFEASWRVQASIAHLLYLYQQPHEPIKDLHEESWYSVNVWAHIIDKGFASVSGITLEREAPHPSPKQGMTKNPPDSSPMDGIIRSLGQGRVEYGLTVFVSSFSKQRSSPKIGRALRNMLTALHAKADHNPDIIGRIQVVGYIIAKLAFQVCRMIQPRASGIALLKYEDIEYIPTDVEGGMTRLLHALVFAERAREIVLRSLSLVEQARGNVPPT